MILVSKKTQLLLPLFLLVSLLPALSDEKIYRLMYDGNGAYAGTVPIDGARYTSGQSASALENSGLLSRPGFAFVAWNTRSDGTGVLLMPGDPVQFGDADLVLYAQWKSALWVRGSKDFGASELSSYQTIDESGNTYVTEARLIKGWASTLEGISTSPTQAIVRKLDPSGRMLWERVLVPQTGIAPVSSLFYDTKVDDAGNVLIAAGLWGPTTYGFAGEEVIQGSSKSWNAALLKLNSEGKVLWSRVLATSAGGTEFVSLALGASGTVTVLGNVRGPGTYEFGPGLALSEPLDKVKGILARYDSEGKALWARKLSADSKRLSAWHLIVDSDGSTYVLCTTHEVGRYSLGDGVEVRLSSAPNGGIVIKFDPDGKTRWARSAIGSGSYFFRAFTQDPSGSIWVTGLQYGSAFDYGSGVVIAGKGAFLVKYDAQGVASSGRSIGIHNPSYIELFFNDIKVDSQGNLVCVGYQSGTASFNFGKGVSASGDWIRSNSVLVKFNPAGEPLWAHCVAAGTDNSQYMKILDIDKAGRIQVEGWQIGDGTYIYGPGASLKGRNSVLACFAP